MQMCASCLVRRLCVGMVCVWCVCVCACVCVCVCVWLCMPHDLRAAYAKRARHCRHTPTVSGGQRGQSRRGQGPTQRGRRSDSAQ